MPRRPGPVTEALSERNAGRVRRLFVSAAFLLVVAGCAGGRVAGEFQRDLPWVKSLEFVGNETFGDGKLRSLMMLKPPSLLRPFRRAYYFRDLLTKDLALVRDYYQDHGYIDFAVLEVDETFSEDREHVRLVIRVREGQRTIVRTVRFEGASALSKGRLEDAIRLEPGKAWSPFLARGDRERIRYAYYDRGYFNANVEVVLNGAAGSVGVTYRIDEGRPSRLRHVTARTNGTTRLYHITREFPADEGEIVRRSDLIETQKRLLERGLFSFVRPRMEPVDTLGTVDVEIEVRERKHGFYGFGFGFSSDERVRLSTEWGHRNVFGTARRIRTTGSIGWEVDSLLTDSADRGIAEQELRLTWVESWFLGTRTEASFAVFHEFDHLPLSFEYRTNGVRATFRRPLSAFVDVFLTLQNEWRSSNDTTFAREDFTSQSVQVEIERDTRDNILDPERGVFQRGTIEYAGVEGDHNFVKTQLSATFALSSETRRGHVLALRFQGGAIIPQTSTGAMERLDRIPSQDRFFVGGATSLRGYRREELGPLGSDGVTRGGAVLYLSSVEYRFPILWRFRGGIFLDSGNIWADPRELKLSRLVGEFGTDYSRLDVRFTAGAGLRLRTPVGPFRVDYGRKIGAAAIEGPFRRDWELHFSLGQAF